MSAWSWFVLSEMHELKLGWEETEFIERDLWKLVKLFSDTSKETKTETETFSFPLSCFKPVSNVSVESTTWPQLMVTHSGSAGTPPTSCGLRSRGVPGSRSTELTRCRCADSFIRSSAGGCFMWLWQGPSGCAVSRLWRVPGLAAELVGLVTDNGLKKQVVTGTPFWHQAQECKQTWELLLETLSVLRLKAFT